MEISDNAISRDRPKHRQNESKWDPQDHEDPQDPLFYDLRSERHLGRIRAKEGVLAGSRFFPLYTICAFGDFCYINQTLT